MSIGFVDKKQSFLALLEMPDATDCHEIEGKRDHPYLAATDLAHVSNIAPVCSLKAIVRIFAGHCEREIREEVLQEQLDVVNRVIHAAWLQMEAPLLNENL